MKNPLIVLASVVVCSIAIPILTSIVSYDSIEATPKEDKKTVTVTKQIVKKTEKKLTSYERINKKSADHKCV